MQSMKQPILWVTIILFFAFVLCGFTFKDIPTTTFAFYLFSAVAFFYHHHYKK